MDNTDINGSPPSRSATKAPRLKLRNSSAPIYSLSGANTYASPDSLERSFNNGQPVYNSRRVVSSPARPSNNGQHVDNSRRVENSGRIFSSPARLSNLGLSSYVPVPQTPPRNPSWKATTITPKSSSLTESSDRSSQPPWSTPRDSVFDTPSSYYYPSPMSSEARKQDELTQRVLKLHQDLRDVSRQLYRLGQDLNQVIAEIPSHYPPDVTEGPLARRMATSGEEAGGQSTMPASDDDRGAALAQSSPQRFCFDCGAQSSKRLPTIHWKLVKPPYKSKVRNWEQHVKDKHAEQPGTKCFDCEKIFITDGMPPDEMNDECLHENRVEGLFPALISVVIWTVDQNNEFQYKCNIEEGCHEWYLKQMSKIYCNEKYHIPTDLEAYYNKELELMLQMHPAVAPHFETFMQTYDEQGKERPRIRFADGQAMTRFRTRLRYDSFAAYGNVTPAKNVESFLEQIYDHGKQIRRLRPQKRQQSEASEYDSKRRCTSQPSQEDSMDAFMDFDVDMASSTNGLNPSPADPRIHSADLNIPAYFIDESNVDNEISITTLLMEPSVPPEAPDPDIGLFFPQLDYGLHKDIPLRCATGSPPMADGREYSGNGGSAS